MPEESPAIELHPYSTHSTFRLVAIQILCLSGVGFAATLALLVSIFQISAQGVTAEWITMTFDPLVAAVGCGVSLAFSIARPSKIHLSASRTLAIAAAIPALFDLLKGFRDSSLNLGSLFSPDGVSSPVGSMPPGVAFAFVLLAAVLCLVRKSRGLGSYVADTLMSVLGFLILSHGGRLAVRSRTCLRNIEY